MLFRAWIPASAGMTEEGAGMTEEGAGMNGGARAWIPSFDGMTVKERWDDDEAMRCDVSN